MWKEKQAKRKTDEKKKGENKNRRKEKQVNLQVGVKFKGLSGRLRQFTHDGGQVVVVSVRVSCKSKSLQIS